jgi:hypothetical protein
MVAQRRLSLQKRLVRRERRAAASAGLLMVKERKTKYSKARVHQWPVKRCLWCDAEYFCPPWEVAKSKYCCLRCRSLSAASRRKHS